VWIDQFSARDNFRVTCSKSTVQVMFTVTNFILEKIE